VSEEARVVRGNARKGGKRGDAGIRIVRIDRRDEDTSGGGIADAYDRSISPLDLSLLSLISRRDRWRELAVFWSFIELPERRGCFRAIRSPILQERTARFECSPDRSFGPGDGN